MASIKVKFRPSTSNDREGKIYYQVIHKRKVRQIKTGYSLFPEEWDARTSPAGASSTALTFSYRHIATNCLRRRKASITIVESQTERIKADPKLSKLLNKQQ